MGPPKLKPALCSNVMLVHETAKLEDVVGNLLYWAVVFLIVALVAAAFGLGGVAGTAIVGAKLLFWVAIVLFIVALIGSLFRRGI